MPQVPLHCKLLDDLDNVDHSFKCAWLFKYLQDMTIELFDSLSATDSDSNVSSISSISSVSVECVHTVALESAISDHVTAPELPKPNDTTQATQSQLFTFPTCCSSASPRSSHFPHLPPSLSANWTQATFSQDAPLATHRASSCYVLGLTQGAFFIFHLLTKPFPSCDQPPIHLDHMTNHLTSHLTTHMTSHMPFQSPAPQSHLVLYHLPPSHLRIT